MRQLVIQNETAFQCGHPVNAPWHRVGIYDEQGRALCYGTSNTCRAEAVTEAKRMMEIWGLVNGQYCDLEATTGVTA